MCNEPTLRLRARGLSKRYGAVQALDDVDFELAPGEVMALLGENGAGKSTFVKVLSGLVTPDAGSIEIDGRPEALGSSAASQRAGIAVVQQEYSTIGALSIAENLLLGHEGARWWWSPKFLRRNAEDLLHRVGLEHLDPRTPVEQLTVAEMQLLEIARVLARDAKVVIFDEPTAALSDREIVRVLTVVRRLAAEGRSIIYVTHRLNEVFEIADRVTIFRNGKSELLPSLAALTVQDIITRMLGRQLGEMYPPHSTDDDMKSDGLTVTDLIAPGLSQPLNLRVGRGQILGLTGQLGSGASTALQAIAGVIPVIAGTVTVCSETLDLTSRRRGIQDGIAYCSADRKRDGIFAGLSTERNLSSPWLSRVSRFGIVRPREERAVAIDIAKQVAIDTSRLQSSVGNLSGGNQQKVVVGKWLGIRPRVLLIDEPTRGVDVGARAEIYRQLRSLSDAGVIIVVSSSDTNEIFGLCDVIATFNRGRLTSLRSHNEWTEQSLVHEVVHSKETAA